MTTRTPRSVYLARLRRAFLLRVHPDRFGYNQSSNAAGSTPPSITSATANGHTTRSWEQIRTNQATLVKALTTRLGQSDFVAWQQQQQHQLQQQEQTTIPASMDRKSSSLSATTPENGNSLQYVLEKRDGSLLLQTIRLDLSVDEIIHSMVRALEAIGVAFPVPPQSEKSTSQHSTVTGSSSTSMTTKATGSTSFSQVEESKSSSTARTESEPSARRYDVISHRGRDLWHFLQTIDNSTGTTTTTWTSSSSTPPPRRRDAIIKDLQANRTDAQAAALAVRRRFGFAAVDATTLGWSSGWVAVLLRRLLQLQIERHHSEHDCSNSPTNEEEPGRKMNFYPIRLHFTNAATAASRDEVKLDVYGAVLNLSPASTSIQWWETFQLVTEEKMMEIRYRQSKLTEYSQHIQETFGVKMRKGYSCSNYEYYNFLENMSQTLKTEHDGNTNNTAESPRSISALVPMWTSLTIESSHVCRIPYVTGDGTIRLGSHTSPTQVKIAVARHGPTARERRLQHEHALQRCKEAIHQLQWQLGVSRVYRVGSLVTHEQFLDCIGRLLSHENHALRVQLGGMSLGIASSGHFCHLGDDGSLVIPHNWH